MYLYDNARDKVAQGYPKKINSKFPNIPNNIDTVFRNYYDGHVYFFKDKFFWKWEPTQNKGTGPHAISLGWKNICKPC